MKTDEAEIRRVVVLVGPRWSRPRAEAAHAHGGDEYVSTSGAVGALCNSRGSDHGASMLAAENCGPDLIRESCRSRVFGPAPWRVREQETRVDVAIGSTGRSRRLSALSRVKRRYLALTTLELLNYCRNSYSCIAQSQNNRSKRRTKTNRLLLELAAARTGWYGRLFTAFITRLTLSCLVLFVARTGRCRLARLFIHTKNRQGGGGYLNLHCTRRDRCFQGVAA